VDPAIASGATIWAKRVSQRRVPSHIREEILMKNMKLAVDPAILSSGEVIWVRDAAEAKEKRVSRCGILNLCNPKLNLL